MKVTLNWLKQYVDFNWSPEELSERLTMLGLEVEGVKKLTGDFEQVVVAQVVTRDRHPNADRLSVCRVNDGTGERQIVCGAQNFQAGDKVPLALPGAVMPTPAGEPPFVIKVGKIRGAESHGMMCSAKELGLPGEAEGLLILPADAQVGQPLAQHLGRSGSDVVYDLEVTPNRPDLNSLIGIAREISALTGNPLRLPAADLPEATGAPAAESLVGVSLRDPELCARYTARVLLGVTVGPSPDWLRQSLEKVGLRSINNVVDVTNYVMLETGQPLHAFDYHLLGKGAGGKAAVVVRRAAAGEGFKTLDGQARTLSDSMLLIADETHGIALAGIMGGENTEIQASTRDVLLESAWFKPQSVRATSKGLGLKTDASYRFERGADVGIAEFASRRAAQLILQTAGGSAARGVVDAFPTPPQPKEISLRHTRVEGVLGIPIEAAQQTRFLTSLGLEVAGAKEGTTSYRIPTWRVDLKREHDLIEEVGRLHGIDRIPSTPPRGGIGSHPYDSLHDQLAEVRRILAGLGFHEAQGQTLIADAAAKLVAPAESLVPLAYPLSSDMNVLRPSLLPGLLDSLRHNLSRQNGDVALFEVGRIFTLVQGEVKEERRVALALTGARAPRFWSGADREATGDLYDLKGALEELFDQFGLRGVAFSRRPEGGAFYLESGQAQLGRQVLGEFGQLSPLLGRKHDLRDRVLLAELNLDLLLARRNAARSFKPLPAFPSIRRDIAMVVPEATTHEAVLAAVRSAKPSNLEAVELFDIFRGKNVPEGQKSVAYAFTYRAPDRTLTDAEVNAAHEKVVAQFQSALQASLRG
ncbi:MAG TPA: phenylalanine--tRNA ligase subunit beta [Verrucomicrobiales bacterium]|nr:phenylalanine--tRNA ligase subunit beta [Verrucomicrobiales bacterium]